MGRYKLALLTSQVVEDQAPLFQKLAKHPEIYLTVYFCWDTGINRPGLEKEFNVKIKYNPSLLEGYNYKFLKNFSLKPSISFFGQINPGIVSELFKNHYDAVIVHGYSHLTEWLAFLGAFLSFTPVFLRGETVLRPNRPFWLRAIKWLVFKPLFKLISAFLSMGSWSEKFYRYYGALKGKIFFTPSAVDNDRFIEAGKSLKENRKSLRKESEIKENDVVILFVGKLIPRKRPFDLLKAYEMLANIRGQIADGVHLIFVGEGALRGELEKYVKEHNLGNVHFVGFKNQTELVEYYVISDIFVSPSNSEEVCPMVINEAMASGLPVIVSDVIPSAFDFVKNDENGFILSFGEVEKLANYLKELILDGNKRKSFGEKSFEIIQGYTYEKDVEGILEALKYVEASNQLITKTNENDSK